jgi:putative NADH-flavin reductase
MKVLVIGGSGKTGRQLIAQGLERGHAVTAMVRNPSSIKRPDPRLNVLAGNVLDKESLTAALAGQDAVLCALGHKKFILKTSILSRGTANLIKAMKRQHLQRLFCITSLGINDSRFRLGLYYSLFVVPFILYYYFRDKEKQERLIMDSGLDWTIIRPGQLTNGQRRSKYLTGVNLGHHVLTKYISRADVAHFMWEILENNRHTREISGITY